MNAYVAGGYGALAAILALYAGYLRHRSRVLAKVVPPPASKGPRS